MRLHAKLWSWSGLSRIANPVYKNGSFCAPKKPFYESARVSTLRTLRVPGHGKPDNMHWHYILKFGPSSMMHALPCTLISIVTGGGPVLFRSYAEFYDGKKAAPRPACARGY